MYYKEFCNGHFVVSKTESLFSSIAIDQAHEQNRRWKGVGDAVGLLVQDMDTALRRSEIAGPEEVRLLNEYEKCHHIGPEMYIGKQHEGYPAFQKMFLADVNNLFNCFKEICNPFKENELIDLETVEFLTPEIQSCLGNLLEMNEEKYQNFRKHNHLRCCNSGYN